MTTPSNINDILSQVQKLDKNEQCHLLQQLNAMLKNTDKAAKNPVNLSSLAGLGNEIWHSPESIDHYIDEERKW